MNRRTFFKRLGMLAAVPVVAGVAKFLPEGDYLTDDHEWFVKSSPDSIFDHPPQGRAVFVGKISKSKKRDGTIENPYYTIMDALDSLPNRPGNIIYSLSVDPPGVMMRT